MPNTKKIYGFVKCKLASANVPLKAGKPDRHTHEIQYHLHPSLTVDDGQGGTSTWDSAINVGTNDSDDLVRYKLVHDFHHPITATLRAANPGFQNLTDSNQLPALDFLRSDILAETGPWRDTDPMDGDESAEPIKSLKRLLVNAHQNGADVYLFGREYSTGGSGIHDIHMNQGSTGPKYLNTGTDNDGNITWQDGGVLVDLGATWSAYFSVFTQQMVPTDDLGNPVQDTHPVDQADDGSLAGSGTAAAPGN